MWHEVVIEDREWIMLHKRAKTNSTGAEFCLLSPSLPWFPRNWYYSATKFPKGRLECAEEYAKYIFERHPISNELLHSVEIEQIRRHVRGKILIHSDGQRCNWAHVLMAIARGANSLDEVTEQLYERFAWENEELRRRIKDRPDKKEAARKQFDRACQAARNKVFTRLPHVLDDIQMPIGWQESYNAIKSEVIDSYGATQQLRRDNFHVVDIHAYDNPVDYTAAALTKVNPLNLPPEFEDDEITSAFQVLVKTRKRKLFLRKRNKIMSTIRRVCWHQMKVLLNDGHRPWTAQNVGPKNNPVFIEVVRRLMGYEDDALGFDVFWGMQIVDVLDPSGIFPRAREVDIDTELVDRMHNSEEFKTRQERRLNTGLPIDGEDVLTGKSHKELDRCESMGPFTRCEMDTIWTPNTWKPLVRFLTWSGGRFREVDSGKASLHNKSTRLFERITCTDASAPDKYCALLKFIWKRMPKDLRCESFDPVLSCEDLQRAYRQIPVAPEHIPMNVTCTPYMGRCRYLVIFSLVFGLSSAVIQFNRCSGFLTHFARMMLGILVINYYDDYLSIEMQACSGLAKRLLYFAANCTGWFIDPAKGSCPSPCNKWLGVMKRISNLRVVSYLDATREKNLREMVRAHLQSGRMTSADASTLLGKFGFAGTTIYARGGAVALHAIRQRTLEEDEHRTDVTPAIAEALHYMLLLMEQLGSFVTHLEFSNRNQYHIFTDASCEESRAAPPIARGRVKTRMNTTAKRRKALQLGWTAYKNKALQCVGYAHMKQHVVDRWMKRQPIGLGETIAAYVGILHAIGNDSHADILIFIDNIGAERAVRRGTSRDNLTSVLSHELHLELAKRDIKVWTCYVPSRCNESDEPSRDCTFLKKPVKRYEVEEFLDLDAIEARMRARGGVYNRPAQLLKRKRAPSTD